MLQKWFVYAVLLSLVPVHLLTNAIRDTENTDTENTDTYIPCEEGWFLFGENCYKLFAGDITIYNQQNWHEASNICKDNGGYLASLPSKEVEDFILTFLLLESDSRVWIGLHDKRKESQFEWLDGTEYNYSNWDFNEPNDDRSRDDQDCVYVIRQSKSLSFGKWHDMPCNEKYSYICQVEKGKQRKVSHDPTVCPRANGGGWKFGHSCFNIVRHTMTWEDAEIYCHDQYKGHLITILNFQTEYFLNYIMENFSTDVWIGIKIKDQIRQKFSSGWPVVYTNWLKTPQAFVDGTCVVLRKGKWEFVPCMEKNPFICEVTTVSPPVLRNHTEDSKCPQLMKDWLDLGGEYCYFIDTRSNYDCLRASIECSRRGSSLASFHSEEELLALAPHAKNALFRNRGVWIGLYGTPDNSKEKKFEWFDGSPVGFTYWNLGEPSENRDTCVEVLLPSMKWNDILSKKEMGYICSVKKRPTSESETGCECTSCITFKIMTGVSFCILFVVTIISVVLNYFRPWKKRAKVRQQPPTILSIPSNGIFHPNFHESRFGEYTITDYENNSDNEYEEMD